jgi:CBS domain-containing protein
MSLKAKDVMTTPVITVTVDTPLKRTAEILDENSFSGVPVVDEEDKLVGILSETDILRYTQQIIGQPLRDPHRVFTKSREVLYVDITHRGVEVIELVANTTVETLMTVELYTASEDTSLFEVARLMHEHNINRIPIVGEGNLLMGIVTRADIISALVNNWRET